ncbi:MAG: RNA polymerase sporulation sigma factor SigK [Clostridia bacterium]|nr:RNA polymerase sporulation sigma factor SigK [Clostridia bacterium]
MFEWIIKLFSKLFFFTGMIRGKNSFAKPLSNSEEKELFAKLKKGDKEAEELLIKHNLRLVAFMAKKYKNYNDQDDLISVGSIGLMKAIKTYNSETKNSFSTYASRCIDNEILMMLRSQRKYSNEVSLEESIGTDKDGNAISFIDVLSEDGEESVSSSVEKNLMIEKVCSIVLTQMDERERDVVSMRYGLFGNRPQTQKEIAKIFGISRSYVSRIEKSALEIIRERIKEMAT